MDYYSLAARALLGTVFALALFGKVRNRTAFRAFAASLEDLGFVPQRLRRPVAATIVGAEASIVVALGVPGGRVGLALSAALLLVMAGGIAVALRLRRQVRCHCFGPSQETLHIGHIVRNALLAGLAVAALFGGPAPVPAIWPSLLAGVAAGLLVVHAAELRYAFWRIS